VTAKLDSPARRILFAIAVSVLVHGLVLWGPDIRLPVFKSSLPALTAKLEPLPTKLKKSEKKRKAATQKPSPKPVPVAEPVDQPKESTSSLEEDSQQIPTQDADRNQHSSNGEVPRPPLPRHAQLTFAVYKGAGGFRVGETVHTLDIEDGRYVLNAVTQTVGLASMFKSFELTQYSSGNYTSNGLEPDLFSEQRKDKLATLRHMAEFDHEMQIVRFAHGGEASLPAETLDILSIMYQFPLSLLSEVIPVNVCNGRKIEKYNFSYRLDEEIDTNIGKLKTVHLRKIRANNEEGLDIWLAIEYRLFPVKLQFIEKNGEVAAEAIITDIRVSEENGVRKDAVD
jgi:hypothetical protein